LAVIAIGLLLSPIDVVPLLVMVPARLIELGAVAVKPALNVILPLAIPSLEALPSIRVPVLRNSVAAVIVLPVPVIDRL
jgi:hypothetical protein